MAAAKFRVWEHVRGQTRVPREAAQTSHLTPHPMWAHPCLEGSGVTLPTPHHFRINESLQTVLTNIKMKVVIYLPTWAKINSDTLLSNAYIEYGNVAIQVFKASLKLDQRESVHSSLATSGQKGTGTGGQSLGRWRGLRTSDCIHNSVYFVHSPGF